ncbi:glutamate--tRNA ligase [Anaerovorax odorimutans]|uniref:glutamate--tRNA ligase n=1 Tax=Anaerovorax odorimutans TaxID=109327 RepID=UPI000423C680|nr:glutamate--tRNA ligase [Anaerovorax odorimutans]
MDYNKLADMLFPNINKQPEEYEERYPERNLPDGAKVTRLGPSPTGFIHLGNLYGAFVDERLAHLSDGIFYLRIEDTDDKREVEGAVEAVISSLDYFGLKFDEGATISGEKGSYGPYHQSKRGEIYQCFVKLMIQKGQAYPCFLTEDEITKIREEQESQKLTPGIYGKWAKHRNLSLEEVEKRINAKEQYVIRFRSEGSLENYFSIEDGVRGTLSMPENNLDVVILKKTGIPTYHFAHVVDDHLMRTTHVIRGEEWLSSLPIHVALFNAMNWELPTYCHSTVLMKMEGETKRKLSKRKDPELSLNYYKSEGYHPAAVREYLLTILNSNFEEWRIENPESSIDEFNFTTDKMSNSGTLFDLDKLNDISKEVLVKIPASELCQFLIKWASEHEPELENLFKGNEDYLTKILDLGRSGKKPRKDLIYAKQIFEFISYFYDDYFKREDKDPENITLEDHNAILSAYLESYDHNDDQNEWFNKIREIAKSNGYAEKPKDFKKNPDMYKGHVGDVSTVIRIALMGRSMSPDIWEIQQILGEERTRERIKSCINN